MAFPCVAVEGISKCIHGCPEHMDKAHPASCRRSCCAWPNVLLADMSFGRCSKCGVTMDEHIFIDRRLVGAIKPFDEPVCPDRKRVAA